MGQKYKAEAKAEAEEEKLGRKNVSCFNIPNIPNIPGFQPKADQPMAGSGFPGFPHFMPIFGLMNKLPLILVTNDDGVFAPGIKALIDVVRLYGEVVVVAPDSPQSGQGHAVTLSKPIRYHEVKDFGDIKAYQSTGTPVDCVKIAKNVILQGRTIDLCVSGINHGSNASINIIYSGTLSAAMEASVEGIPSIGFSLLDYSFDADFTTAKIYVDKIVRFVLAHGMTNGNLINVNIPSLPANEIRGIRVCRQAVGRWVEEFAEGTDPRGEKYYWLTGKFVVNDKGEDHDIWALENGYISVVPSLHDLTNYAGLTHFGELMAMHDSKPVHSV